MKKEKLISVLLSLTLAASTLAGCGGEKVSADATQNGETLVYGMGSSWDTLFPYGGNAEDYGKQTFKIMYTQFVYTDGSDNFVDNGVIYKDSYTSTDGKAITFKVNSELKWSDGETYSAEDWLYTIQTISDPSLVCTRKNYFNILNGIDASGNLESGASISDAITVDGDTFTLYLDDATNIDSFLYTYNDFFFVLPKHCLEGTTPAELASIDFWDKPVTTGPWVLEEEIAGSQLTFGRNEYFPYWDDYSNISNFVLKVVGTDVMVEGIASGEIHNIMSTMSAGDCAEATTLDGVSGETLEEPTMIVIMAFNLQKLTDERIRRAFDYAINREYLCEQVMGGQAVPVNTFERSKWLNKDIKTEYSLDKAKELFDAAAADGTFDYSKPITVGVVSGFREQIAAILKDDLAKIGVELELIVGDGTTILGKMQESGAYDICLVGGGMSANATWPMNDYFNPSVNTYGQLTDSKYYDMCVAINGESDADVRYQKIQELQAIVYEEAPYVFVFNMVSWRLYSSALKFRDDNSAKAFSGTGITMPWNVRIER